MLQRIFTIEELSQFSHMLNKFWQTQYRVQSDNDVKIGQELTTWVFTTLQNVKNTIEQSSKAARSNEIEKTVNICIEETLLNGLAACLHYSNCVWKIHETLVYTQFLNFAREFFKNSEAEFVKNNEVIENKKGNE